MNYFRYYKDKASGGIYDLEATQYNRDVGEEVDVQLSWQIFSDLKFTVQYGYFWPGDAYPDSSNDNQEYFSASTTITF